MSCPARRSQRGRRSQKWPLSSTRASVARPQNYGELGEISRAPLWRNYARSEHAAGGTPLLESFDVRVGEQQCAMRNVGLPRLVEHEAQDVLDLRRATAFEVTQHRSRVLCVQLGERLLPRPHIIL